MRVIYALIDPKNDQPRYVGQTSRSLRERYNEHHKFLNHPRLPVQKWVQKLHRTGLIGELKIVVLEHVDEEFWQEREVFWIKELGGKYDLLNITPGGEGLVGYTHSEETRVKIRAKRALQTFSVETRKKLSRARLGNQYAKGIHYKRDPKDLKKTWATRRKDGTDKGHHFTRKPEDLKKTWITRRANKKI